MMQPNELCFCVHSLAERDGEDSDDEEYKNLNVITFCPISYWKEHRCLPDYSFDDEINDEHIPKEYSWYLFVEETMMASKKSKEEIVKDFTSLGFSENKELEKFLFDCYR